MVSFDIFDTLITRKTFSPYGIFMLVQKQLCKKLDTRQYQYICNNYTALRISAEKDARLYAEQAEREEVTLDEIYNLFAYRNNLPEDIINFIKILEIQTELDNTCPIIENINLLESFLLKGEHIILISDMYLNTDIIKKILLKNSIIFDHIPVYISSEFKKTKNSGNLYFEIANKEKESFSHWIHYGDNRISDYLVPKMIGIDARYLPTDNLMPWEKRIGEQFALKENLVLQLYFGTLKNLRLEKNMSLAGQIGASLGGMILYPYVLWLIYNSIERGIKRLYFIARDGYILKKIADLIIKNHQLDIYTAYVYGSRKAWRVNYLSEEEKKLVIQYLFQVVDFSDEYFAFVDLNGTGYTMECLSKEILKSFHVKTKVFYFDIKEYRCNDYCIFMSFHSVCSNIIEVFCRAPHGATIGYEQKGQKILPKIKLVSGNYWEDMGLNDYLEGVELFAEKMSEYQFNDCMIDINLVEALIEYCKREPCKEVQDFLGNIPHCNGNENESFHYAPMLSLKDIFGLYMLRTIEDISKYYSGADLKFSLFRTGHKYDKIIAFFEKNYNCILGKCIHKFKNRRYKKENCQNVAIYAAGDVGKRLYGHLSTIPGFHVKAWTDMDYERYIQLGYPVVPLQEALKTDFDYIIIALNNMSICKKVQKFLEGLGINIEKIITYKEFLEKNNW